MPLVKLELDNLSELDDRIIVAYARAIKEAVLDCMDRPGDKTVRTVNLEMKLTPVIGEEGQCDGCDGEFQIKTKIPARKSKLYSFQTNRKGHLVFSTTNPEDVNQTTLDDIMRIDQWTTRR